MKLKILENGAIVASIKDKKLFQSAFPVISCRDISKEEFTNSITVPAVLIHYFYVQSYLMG